jgi:succinate dehydrogenase / fumarate reductase membrane anchor subunit
MAAHEGSGHFKWQRLTSIAMLPLMIYSVAVVVSLAGADYATATARLSSPLVWAPILALILIAAWHMRLGMQVIIDDYTKGGTAAFLHALSLIFTLIVVAIAVYATYQLSFGA